MCLTLRTRFLKNERYDKPSYYMSKKEIISISVVIFLFLAGAFVAREYAGYIVLYLDHGVASMLVYMCAGIFATVVAPVSTLPLIPIAVALWGPFVTGTLSVIAWSIGSVVAFFIARRFGKPIVAHFVNLEKISKYEKALGEKYLFWDLVFLRAAVPVDILSYAVGLFTSIGIGVYTLATFIGIIPFAFIFSYASRAPLLVQFLFGVLAVTVMYVGYRKIHRVNF